MRLLGNALGAIPSRLACFGQTDEELAAQFQQMYPSSADTVYSGYGFQPTDTPSAAPADQPYTYSGPGEETEYTEAKAVGVQLSPENQKIADTYGATTPAAASATPSTAPAAVKASSDPKVAVQPSTETQVFNLIDTVAKGLLAVEQVSAQTKLSTAQIAAKAEASKVQAQDYVMQQLQQGKQVMVPQSWLQQYASSDTLTKWLTPILIIGGVGLLGYAVYKHMKNKKAVAKNPHRRR